jgi:predicted transposase YdaD
MFELNDLRQTRFFQDVFEEGKKKGKQEAQQEVKLEVIPHLLQRFPLLCNTVFLLAPLLA